MSDFKIWFYALLSKCNTICLLLFLEITLLNIKTFFYSLNLQKRTDYIENAIHKDMKFRNSLKGMIIGQFTVEEYLLYIKNSSALNKRMMNIVKERLLSNIQLFEKPEFLKAV